MRLPEQLLWDWLRDRMGNLWFAQRIENRVGTNIPDVHFALRQRTFTGWIELKSIPDWGKNEGSAFRLPKWTQGQRNWARDYAECGGQCWLAVQVQETDEVIVLPSRLALEMVDHWAIRDVRHCGRIYAKRTCSTGTLLDALAS